LELAACLVVLGAHPEVAADRIPAVVMANNMHAVVAQFATRKTIRSLVAMFAAGM